MPFGGVTERAKPRHRCAYLRCRRTRDFGLWTSPLFALRRLLTADWLLGCELGVSFPLPTELLTVLSQLGRRRVGSHRGLRLVGNTGGEMKVCKSATSRSLLMVDLSGIFFFATSCLLMFSQIPCKYAFAKQGLLGLLSRLEGDVGDAAAADELAQTFSVALEMVHLAAADAEVDVAVDSEVTDCLNLARARLLPHASASWLEHSPHLVAGKEEEFRSVAVAPLAPLDVAGGYARLTEYWQQVEAGTMSRSEFEAHRSAILMADPGLGLPSSLAVSSPLLRLSMEPSPVGGGASPAVALSELFSNQTLHSPVVRAATAALSPSGFAATPSEAAAASIASGSQSRRRTAEPAPAADSVPPRGIKRGRDAPLMDVSQIPGYVRCLGCIQRKVKCAPFVGTAPPYPCSHCVSAGRECRRAATGRARGRPAAAVPSGAAPSGAAATSSLRLPASAFFAPEMPSSGVGLAATVMFWRGEIARTLAARRALDVQLSFADKPPRKRARTSSSRGPPRAPSTKGKEKAIDVDALSDGAGDAEAMDDAEDGAGVGGDGADDGNGAGDAESSWTGFAASFGYA
ncbi:hypothetical protein EDB83DRAFT_2322234 [Lactarius deliciosus]|nr:hypothetical protein EDB83DRAFT_2322234 [Lactarius deliciosus]